MLKLAIVICYVILLAPVCYGANYYIAPSAAGSQDGSSCDNAKAASWNWTSPNVAAGDTVYICPGTYTSTLTIPQSFSSPGVTVKFMSGATFSKAYWGTTTSAAIYMSNKSYITVDGDNVGIIECTDNGDELTYQQNSTLIYISEGSNVAIKNLTLRNNYIHVARNNSTPSAYGIYVINTNDVTLSGNTISHCSYGFAYVATSSNSNVYVYNNSVTYSSGNYIALNSVGTVSLDNVQVYNNSLKYGPNWHDANNTNHGDPLHFWAQNYISGGTGQMTNLKVYNNYIYGTLSDGVTTGTSTAAMYFEYLIINPQIYNNVIIMEDGGAAWGAIGIKNIDNTATNYKIYNNTIVGAGTTTGMGTGILYSCYGNCNDDLTITTVNNIFYNLNVAMSGVNDNVVNEYDYNLFNTVGNIAYISGTSTYYSTLSSWRTFLGGCPNSGNDCSSVTDDPLLSATYTLQAGSGAIAKGTATGQLSATDKAGVTWNSPPSIGAYEYNPTLIRKMNNINAIGVRFN